MSLVAILVVLAAYNVIVFTIPFHRGGMFWTGYGFSMFAMFLTAAVGFYALDREGLRSKVYGVPFLFIVQWYLIIQIIVGLIEMVLPSIPYKYGIAINSILLGYCLIRLIIVNMGKEEIERLDEKIKDKVFHIKSLQLDVESLTGKASEESVKKVLSELAETIRYSDPMSSPQLTAIENKIESRVAVLPETVDNADFETVKTICNELQLLFAERNQKCKTLK
jgi:hypothetical protein